MILKVEDALKTFSRTPARLCHSGGDPDCEAHRDLRVIFPTASCCDIRIIYQFIPPQLCCEVVNSFILENHT